MHGTNLEVSLTIVFFLKFWPNLVQGLVVLPPTCTPVPLTNAPASDFCLQDW